MADSPPWLLAVITATAGFGLGLIAKVFATGMGAAGLKQANDALSTTNTALEGRVKCLEENLADSNRRIEHLEQVIRDLQAYNRRLQKAAGDAGLIG